MSSSQNTSPEFASIVIIGVIAGAAAAVATGMAIDRMLFGVPGKIMKDLSPEQLDYMRSVRMRNINDIMLLCRESRPRRGGGNPHPTAWDGSDY